MSIQTAMSIYEETTCDDCGETKLCRRTDSGAVTHWICLECQQVAKLEAQAIADADFDCMRYRLTPKGEQALAEMQGGTGW